MTLQDIPQETLILLAREYKLEGSTFNAFYSSLAAYCRSEGYRIPDRQRAYKAFESALWG